MGLLEDLDRDLKKVKRKAKSKLVREVLGETKGERSNRRRLKMAQEAWAYYRGPMRRREFMSWYMKKGVARSKKVLKQEITKWDKKALREGKKLNVEKVIKILNKLSISRVPKSEEHLTAQIEKIMPGGIREYGEFIFAGTSHRPDFYVNKDIAFENKIIRSNTELHTAIGQALIYRYKFSYVFLILYDARHGYDIVDFTDKELAFLGELGIGVYWFPD